MSPARQGRGSASAEALEERPETEPWQAEAEEHPSSFDPGVETGYLRRGVRDHDLAPEIGAAPFDPGPDHYDDRRARRRERRAEKAERKRRKQEERREREEREQREAELKALAESEADRKRERREAAKRELERAREKRERVARLVAGERERERAAHLERERRLAAERRRQLQSRREHARREQVERARRAGPARERIERDRAPRERVERGREQPAPAPKRPPASTSSPSPQLRRIPAGATPGPRPRVARRPRRSLRRPTLKAAVALAAVSAAAVGAGALLGLPLPGPGSSAEPGRSAAALGPATEGFTLDGGTPVGLTSGPYFPVVLDAPANFGEGAAKFGAARGGRRHEGQDIFARPGTPLIAVRDGIVLDGAGGNTFYAGGGGNTLVIYSPLDDRSYVYLHLLKPALVRAGEEVRAGQPVGQVGCTGSCFGPHLHFEVRNGRADWGAETKAVDPLPVLRQWPQVPRTQK